MKPLLHHLTRPAQPGAGKPPMLILLHGVGSNERDMAALAPAIDPRFLVLSVRSPLQLGPDAYAWFNVRFTASGPVIDASQAEAGWKTLGRFIRDAVGHYGADASQVYVAGFSQGGIMSLAALLTEPGLVAGAVSMSGRLLPEVLPHATAQAQLAGKPVLLVHGIADARLAVTYARQAKSTLERLGLDITYQEFPMGHEITSGSAAFLASWLKARLDAPAG